MWRLYLFSAFNFIPELWPFLWPLSISISTLFCFLLNSCNKYIAYHLNKLCITGGRGRFYYRENKEFWVHRQGMHFIIRLRYKSADDCIHFYLYSIDMKGFCSCGFVFYVQITNFHGDRRKMHTKLQACLA